MNPKGVCETAVEEPEFHIYPTSDGVVIDLSNLNECLPLPVIEVYADVLDAAIPDHEGYIATTESDGNLHIMARGTVISDPLKFAHVQLEVARLANDIASVFINAYELGTFKAQPENAE